MSKVVITIEDTGTGTVITMDPPDLVLLNKALESQGLGCTPAEMMAVYVRRAALQYNAEVIKQSSPLVLARPGELM